MPVVSGRSAVRAGDQRQQLKHRQPGGQNLACPPELAALLREHLEKFGTARGGASLTVNATTTNCLNHHPEHLAERPGTDVHRTVRAAPFAATPYDLRHASMSTWLNGGVPSTDVAAWAGHSVEILHRIYAKCLDGGAEALRRRVQSALGHG